MIRTILVALLLSTGGLIADDALHTAWKLVSFGDDARPGPAPDAAQVRNLQKRIADLEAYMDRNRDRLDAASRRKREQALATWKKQLAAARAGVRKPANQLVAGSTITLDLRKPGQASGSAGCNRYFGKFETDADGAVKTGAFASTRKACLAPGVMEQERRYLGQLGQVERYRLADGRLVLTGPGVKLVYASAGDKKRGDRPGPADAPRGRTPVPKTF